MLQQQGQRLVRKIKWPRWETVQRSINQESAQTVNITQTPENARMKNAIFVRLSPAMGNIIVQ